MEGDSINKKLTNLIYLFATRHYQQKAFEEEEKEKQVEKNKKQASSKKEEQNEFIKRRRSVRGLVELKCVNGVWE